MTRASCAPGLGQGLEKAYAACADQVRRYDPDRHAACLFAPRASQPALFALYAFNAEIARVRELVSDPMPGEIRHQWWREALACKARGHAHENPVADALNDTLRRYRLPPEPLLALIEARGFDLYDDPMPTWLDLEGYCGETASTLIRLATLILADGTDAGSADLCGHAGVAYAMTGLLRAFPIHARRQQCFIPHEALITCGLEPDEIFEGRDSDNLRAVLAQVRARAQGHFDKLRGRIGELDSRIRAAFFPVCLCPGYLAQMEKPDYNPFETRIETSPLARLWTIGKSAWWARG
jgi:15-cis-phytoene synthase